MRRFREPEGEILLDPPLRFDTMIGYWTGEPDEEALDAGLAAVARQGSGAVASRCPRGHLHLHGPPDALAAAEAALVALGFTRATGGCEEAAPNWRG